MAPLEAAGTGVAKKRRRNILTIDQKLEICKLVHAGMSHTITFECYDIRRSTVASTKARAQVSKHQPEASAYNTSVLYVL